MRRNFIDNFIQHVFALDSASSYAIITLLFEQLRRCLKLNYSSTNNLWKDFFILNNDILLGVPVEFVGYFFYDPLLWIVICIKINVSDLPKSSDLNDFCLLNSGAQCEPLTWSHLSLHFRHGLNIFPLIVVISCGIKK